MHKGDETTYASVSNKVINSFVFSQKNVLYHSAYLQQTKISVSQLLGLTVPTSIDSGILAEQ